MAKPKKAAPKKAKVAMSVNITKRRSFKRASATSTPLSKAKLSIGVIADSPTIELVSKAFKENASISAITKNKNARSIRNTNKSDSIIIETPKRLAPAKGVKRGAPAINNSVASELSPKKPKRQAKKTAPAKKGNKSLDVTIKSTVIETTITGRSTRNIGAASTKLAKHAIKSISNASSPKNASPVVAKGRKKKVETSPVKPKSKRGANKNSPVKTTNDLSLNEVKATRGKKNATSPKKATKLARRSKGVVATKAKRLSGVKPASPKKKGRLRK